MTGRPRGRPRKKRPSGPSRSENFMELVMGGDPEYKIRSYMREPLQVFHENSAAQLSLEETVDPWDAENQQNMRQLEALAQPPTAQNLQPLYEKFQKMREIERIEMEKRGLVDRPTARKHLRDALSFVGTCQDMCPTFERIRRMYENNVKALERDDHGRVTSFTAVKAFSRPAAGQPPPLPSDVRPPSVLVKTLGYLLQVALPQLPRSHLFLWDRTRSIRQDFTYQNYAGPEAIYCNEVIVRVHIFCLHVMAGFDVEYSRQQELEQLNKALQTLSEMYALHGDARNFPNEPEMRAYQLLSHLYDPDMDYMASSLPSHIRKHPFVILARDLRSLVNTNSLQSLFGLFFAKVRQEGIPVLFQCLLEVRFNDLRLAASRALRRALKNKAGLYKISRFSKSLGYDDEAQARSFLKYYEMPIRDDCVDIKSWDEIAALDKPTLKQPSSKFISEHLRFDVIIEKTAFKFPTADVQPFIPHFEPVTPNSCRFTFDEIEQFSKNLMATVARHEVELLVSQTLRERNKRKAEIDHFRKLEAEQKRILEFQAREKEVQRLKEVRKCEEDEKKAYLVRTSQRTRFIDTVSQRILYRLIQDKLCEVRSILLANKLARQHYCRAFIGCFKNLLRRAMETQRRQRKSKSLLGRLTNEVYFPAKPRVSQREAEHLEHLDEISLQAILNNSISEEKFSLKRANGQCNISDQAPFRSVSDYDSESSVPFTESLDHFKPRKRANQFRSLHHFKRLRPSSEPNGPLRSAFFTKNPEKADKALAVQALQQSIAAAYEAIGRQDI